MNCTTEVVPPRGEEAAISLYRLVFSHGPSLGEGHNFQPLSPGPLPGEEVPVSQGQFSIKERRPEPWAANTHSIWGTNTKPAKGIWAGRPTASLYLPEEMVLNLKTE